MKTGFPGTYKSIIFYILLITLSQVLTGCFHDSDKVNSSDKDDSAVDKIPPVITLIGDNPVTIAQNETYTDPGATANDNIDGTVTVEVSGNVDTSVIGTYTLTYTASDKAGNKSTSQRTVNVVDVTAPEITIVGDNPATIAQNATYTDPGATANDDVDGSVTVEVSGNIDSSIIGTYILTYTAKDKAGNQSSVERTVNVVDVTPPIITIVGDNPITVAFNETFTDPGATAIDDVDGDVTVEVSGNVDSSVIGSYTLTYTATDKAGNQSSVERTVNVIDVSPPVIVINGDNPITIAVNSDFIDLGATAIDDVDGNVAVTPSGTVDTSTEGSYTINYTAIDNAGNESNSSRTVHVKQASLSGTAAAGAAIVGTVTVKGSLGKTVSTAIEADGNYQIDVSGLVAPFRIRATGTVGKQAYKLHSYATEADLGNTINITPFTDLIIANAARQATEIFFESEENTSLDEEEIDAQETALQRKLQDILDALGVDPAIDLLNTSFNADHSGLDAVLDIIKIENISETIVQITNLIDGTSIQDDITFGDDNDESLSVDKDNLNNAVSDIQAITSTFSNLSSRLKSGSSILRILSNDFLEHDQDKSTFISEITTDPTYTRVDFASIAVTELDSVMGSANVSFNVMIDGEIDPEKIFWLVGKDETLGWQLRGDQRIVDLDAITYHCNDSNGFDELAGSCGINVAIRDENFANNGTGGEAISSASVTILDGSDESIKAQFYLGTSENAPAGELQVYNEGIAEFQGDWRSFGSAAGAIASTTFAPNDIVRYSIYTQPLDLSVPSMPVVSIGNEIATYSVPILFSPEVTGLYPELTPETLADLDTYTLGDSISLTWVLTTGTVSDEVLVELTDGAGNQIEISRELLSPTATTIAVSADEIAQLMVDNPYFDPYSDDITMLIRIYARAPLATQYHSTDYQFNLTGEQPELTCGYESGWDENADTGLGRPFTPRSFADFEALLADCGGGLAFSAEDFAGKVFISSEDGYLLSFNNDGKGTEAEPSTGSGSFLFHWYVEEASDISYLVIYSDSTIDSSFPEGYSMRETTALLSITGAKGVELADYSLITYFEGSNFGDMDRDADSDGAISLETMTLGAIEERNPQLVCGYESGWDSDADNGLGAPITPNSFADFEALLADCGGALELNYENIAGKAFFNENFPFGTEDWGFNDDGQGTKEEPNSGAFVIGSKGTIKFNWYIEQAGDMDYLVMYSNSTIDSNIPEGYSIRQTTALLAITDPSREELGQRYFLINYFEGANFGDMVRDVGSDGEIWFVPMAVNER
ncbi:DUF5011 domain-containing protein [Thalassotalea maritima]|uniref:DUF5011 domain-containing protein n=1 Tax=Thalassotalea maritima TaxID=3242416 RepID=UPI0035294CC2